MSLQIVKIPVIYNFCKNCIVNKDKDRIDTEGNILTNHYEKIDAAPWKAKEAYQLHWSDGILDKYILCYENCIVKIDFDWEPTDNQKEIVAEKLSGE